MLKGKLCGVALASMIGTLSISPITSFAAETNSVSVTESKKNTHPDKKAAFEEKKKNAMEKWNGLTEQQKNEVYAILEDELKSDMRLINKLVALGVLEQEDGEKIKAHKLERFNEIKEKGELPFYKQKRHKSSK